MITTLLIIAALPWLLILLHLVSRRSFTVLLVWLLIAPAVAHFIQPHDFSGQTVLFVTAGTTNRSESDSYYEGAATITAEKLFNPTRILFGLVMFVFVLNACLKRTRRVPLDKIEIWMGVFSLILAVSVFFWSKRLAFGLHVAVDAFIIPFFGYFLFRRLVRSEERWNQLIRVIGYMGFYVIIYCVIERVTTERLTSRLVGPFGNWDVLHVIMVVVFFTALLDALCNGQIPGEKPALPRVIRWFVMFMAPVVILLTLTRGNWVGFLSGVLVFCVLGRRLAGISQQVGAFGLTVVTITIIGVCLPLFVPEEIIETRVVEESNVLGRFATWMATIQIAWEAPIFGVGVNNLHGLLATERAYLGDAVNYSTPHNSYLSIFVELGAVGFVTYVAVILIMTRMGLNLYRRGADLKDRWRGVGLVAIMVAYLIPSLFSNTLTIPGLIHLYVYVFAGAIAGLYGPLHSTSTQRAFSYPAYRKAAYQLPYATPTWTWRNVERRYER